MALRTKVDPRAAGSADLVIIGFAEALSAPEVVWSLADAGYRVIAFARRGSRTPLRSSKYVTIREIHAPESNASLAELELKHLLAAVAAENPDCRRVLLPLDDAALWLSCRIDRDSQFRLAGPTGENAALALDKWSQVAAAKSAGFSVPATRRVVSREEVFGQPLSYPVVLKPVLAAELRAGGLTRGRAWFCSTAAELEDAVDEWAAGEPMLLQNYVAGVGEGIFGLAAEQGVIAWSAHRRLRMMNPQGSGSSACISNEPEESLQAASARLIAQTRWSGLFMIELLRDAEGRPWFMELNGRSWGSMALARRHGLEYPAWAVALTLDPGAAITLPARNPGPLVCRHLGREFIHLAFALRGPTSSVRAQWPSRWSAVSQFCHFSRHDRWYNWRRDDSRVFWDDLYLTLHGQLFKKRGKP